MTDTLNYFIPEIVEGLLVTMVAIHIHNDNYQGKASNRLKLETDKN
jgi:hypothetical protein